jgi:hypothetical protein
MGLSHAEMQAVKRIFPWFLLAVAAVALLGGCASTKGDDVDPNGDAVSTTPWNKPTSWESSGALGGALGH